MLIVIALTIYCTVEVAQSPTYQVRVLPKWLWAIAVICLPIVGPIAWLIVGRPRPDSGSSQATIKPPPDDDFDFLRKLR